MANWILDNTYIIQESALTALSWPTDPRLNAITIFALNTNANALMIVAANSPVFAFNFVTALSSGAGGGAITPSTYTFPLYGTQYATAWIPTLMTACTAWLHFG